MMTVSHKLSKRIPLLYLTKPSWLKREVWNISTAGLITYHYCGGGYKSVLLQGHGVGLRFFQENSTFDYRFLHITSGNQDNGPYESLREIPVKVTKKPRLVYSVDDANPKDNEKSVENDEFTLERAYETHIPTNIFQRGILSVGAAAAALLDPQRHDMVAVLGETTGYQALSRVYTMMVQDSEGQQILMDKPRVNSSTIDISCLSQLPKHTLGYFYIKFLNDNNVTPDSRLPVQFVDDPELAYVMQRYREGHDMFHTILGMPTNMLGEVAVKWVEALQTGLPMCYGAAVFGPLRFRPKQRQKYLSVYLPWALRVGRSSKLLMNMYFEKRWDQPIDEIRNEFGIKPFPTPV